jgi:TonB family protein
VNAVGTPLGAYVKNVSTIVGSRWNFKVKEQMEWLTAGAVKVRFTVDRQGRTGNIEVEANNSNRNFAELCVQVIRDSKLEPIPPEVVEHLEQERLEIPFTFTLYPTH